MEFTRFVILVGGGLAQSDTKYELGFERSRVLGLCGFVCDGIDDVGSRYQIEKCNCLFDRNTPHWSETKNNFIICAALSLQDAKSQSFVNACLRHPDFKMFIKKGEKGRVLRPKDRVGAALVRQATTRAGLKRTPWEEAEEAVYFLDNVLEQSTPRISATQTIEDCFQVAIIDCGEGEMKDFVEKLVEIWLKVYGLDDFRDILYAIGEAYITMGEIQVSKEDVRLIKSREDDILKSYQLLWGRSPREGHLADDEAAIKVGHPLIIGKMNN